MSTAWKMLAPVDLSRCAEEQVRRAVSVGTSLSAEVDLVYMADPRSLNASPERDRFDLTGSVVTGESDIRRHIATGPPASVIAEHGDSVDADLVFITSHRFGKWNRFWRRSVTEDLMHLVARPLCIVSANATDEEFRFRRRRILCVPGLDGRETALIEYAQELAARTAAELILLHVVPDTNEGLLHFGLGKDTRPLSTERAARELAALVRRMRVPALTSVMAGNPERCIPLSAREHSVDLVLLSRAWRGCPAAYSHCIGSVLSRLRCPLITVPVDSGPLALFSGEADAKRVLHQVSRNAGGHGPRRSLTQSR